MKKNKTLIIIACVVVALTAGQLVILGALAGIGPLKFMRQNKLARLPGNAPEYHIENLTPLADSPLKGKRLLFLGSSVTRGDAALGVSMAEYIQFLDGCNVVKSAVNGTTLTDTGSNSYVSRLKGIDPAQSFDAVIVQLSTNDATKKKPLGEVIESRSLSDFDTQTVLGAMEYIIAYSQEIWNCPVVFYTGTKYDSEAYQAMVDGLLRIQEKWDIGVIDLWNDPEMNAVSAEEYAVYMNDPIHPTQAGYLKWWTPKFESYLYNYLSPNA